MTNKWQLLREDTLLGEYDTENGCMRAGDRDCGQFLAWGITPEGHRYANHPSDPAHTTHRYLAVNPSPVDYNPTADFEPLIVPEEKS